MQITFKVQSKGNQILRLFGARFNYLASCYGNSSLISFEDVEVCEEYERLIGGFTKESYNKVSSILMDCIKHDFIIDEINGIVPKIPIKDTNPIEYEYRVFNPYNEECVIEIKDGENAIEVKLHKIFK